MVAMPWRPVGLATPGIVAAVLSKAACPACWPLYAGALSAMGLGFLVDPGYGLPLSSGFLLLALGPLAYRAPRRRGYGPLLTGALGAAAVVAGVFVLRLDGLAYLGVGGVIGASIWNAIPPPRVAGPAACPRCAIRDQDDPRPGDLNDGGA